MIVRDEEAVLRRCLDSIAPHVEAIAIVDTGSVDSTMEIARSYTKHVSTFYSANEKGSKEGSLTSFAEARNQALLAAEPFTLVQDGERRELSPYPFGMWLDASDVVVGGENLLEEVESDTNMSRIAEEGLACHLCLDTQMLDHTGRVSQRFSRERVFARGKYRWKGTIHETLHGSEPSREFFSSRIVVQRPFREGPRKDPDRNLRILKRLVESGEEPTPRNIFYLGREYADRGDYAPARKWLLLYLSVSNFEDEKASALLLLAELCAARGDLDEALQHALYASVVKENARDPLIAIGKILYRKASRGEEFKRNRERAMAILVRALETKPVLPSKMISAPHPEIEAYRILGCCHMDLGAPNQARAYFEDALKIEPEDEACKNLLERAKATKGFR